MSAQPLESAPKSNIRLDLTGLEDLFEQELEPFLARGLSIKEAVFFYGVTKKQLKKQIKKSLIPAVKIIKQERNKWLVYPDGIPQELEQLSPPNVQNKPTEDKAPPAGDKATSIKTKSRSTQAKNKSKAARLEALPAEATISQAQSVEDFRQAFEKLPRQNGLTDNRQILDFRPDLNDPFILPTEQPLSFHPEDSYFSRIIELEQLLVKAHNKNEYLETRIGGLEDQVKFLIQAQYSQPSFNRLSFVIPILVALSVICAACFPAFSGS